MSKCFISYTHAKPDIELAAFLDRFLTSQGHDVFIDTRILPGKDWVKEIETHLMNCRVFIVLISAESIRSEMVREEVRRAHLCSKEHKDKYIIPIRVGYDGSLPYDLAAYLHFFQWITWNPPGDVEVIAQRVLDAVEKHGTGVSAGGSADDPGPGSGVMGLYEVTEMKGAPLPGADSRMPCIEMETGTLAMDSPFYVKRESDTEMDRQMGKTGTTTIVKGARQMGKSSLLTRAKASAVSRGHRVFYIDFQSTGKSILANPELLCLYLAEEMHEEFKTTLEPAGCWKKYRGPMQNLTRFMEEGILKSSQSELTVMMDEVDLLFGYDTCDDFFSAIRAWHNNRAADPGTWKRFNIVLAHSTEPYLWIKDMNRSPFNVGTEIKMKDFGKPEAAVLNEKHGMVLKTQSESDRLLDFTGGQPYLSRLAFYTMASLGLSLQDLEKKAAEEDGPFCDHLRRFLWGLKNDKEMMRAISDVLKKGMCETEEEFLRLRAGGLVKGESKHRVEMRCGLYRDYFQRHL